MHWFCVCKILFSLQLFYRVLKGKTRRSNKEVHNSVTLMGVSQVALVVKNLSANAGDTGDMGSIRESVGRRQPTPVFFPGKSHGQRNLLGYSLWGCKRAGHDQTTKQQQIDSNGAFYTVRNGILALRVHREHQHSGFSPDRKVHIFSEPKTPPHLLVFPG